MNALTPRAPARRSRPCARRAGTCRRSAPFVIHCFAPVIVQPPSVAARPSCAARPRPSPASASVSANAPSCSPRASGGTKRDALLVGAEREDRQRRRARVHRDRHAHARVGARELLQHEDVREEVRARAAVLLRDADAHQPELGQLRGRARAGSGARDPTARRSARSRPSRTRASSAWISRCSWRQLEVHARDDRPRAF